MSQHRLAASVEVSALLRRAAAAGDFGVVLRQGDSERGALLIVVTHRGEFVACLQRRLDFMSGTYSWTTLGPAKSSGSVEVSEFLARQARFDPDMWQIELDTADPERFIAETTGPA